MIDIEHNARICVSSLCIYNVWTIQVYSGVKMSGGIAAELKDRIYSWQWIGGFGERDGYSLN